MHCAGNKLGTRRYKQHIAMFAREALRDTETWFTTHVVTRICVVLLIDG